MHAYLPNYKKSALPKSQFYSNVIGDHYVEPAVQCVAIYCTQVFSVNLCTGLSGGVLKINNTTKLLHNICVHVCTYIFQHQFLSQNKDLADPLAADAKVKRVTLSRIFNVQLKQFMK